MNCAQCQTANSPEATFCRNCGAQLNQVGEPAYNGGPAQPAPAGGYGAPQGGYQAPQGGYQEPPTARYTPPKGGYQPPPGQTPPQGQSTPPQGGYQAPQGQYQPPQNGYQPPQNGYQAPQGGYQGPQGQPQNGYQGPQGPYQPPQGGYQPGQSGPVFGGKSALPPVRFDLGRLTKVDRIVAGATFVAMISIWLPWFTAHYSALGESSSGSASGTHVHGWLWLEFLLALALLAYLGARAAWETLPVRVPVAHELILAAATGLQFLLILIAFLARPSTNGLEGYSIHWGFGAFLGLIAAIVAAGPVVYPVVKAYLDRRKGAPAQRY